MTANPTPATILIRADASSAIGTGHLMRCLALAEAAQDRGWRVAMACREIPESLGDRLREENLVPWPLRAEVATREDAEETLASAREVHAGWIVVDGYRFGPDYYGSLRTQGMRVFALDDMAHCSRYPVDLLLNQNLHATPELYAGKIDSDTETLLGPGYCLLRREFRAQAGACRAPATALRRLLVSFGGSDAENLTATFLETLAGGAGNNLEVVVLAGGANRAVPELRNLARSLPFACEVRVNVRDVAAVMAWADVAATAGGSTVWELASMRLPALIVGVSPDQLMGLSRLRSVPIFQVCAREDLGKLDLMGQLTSLLESLKGRDLNDPAQNGGIDTEGAMRVLDAMKTHRSAADRAAGHPDPTRS